jgi:hypothetical protein
MSNQRYELAATAPVFLFSPTREEHEILARAERYLEDALALKRWWTDADARGAYQKRFELERTFNRAASSYGFFGEALIAGGTMPVMGNVQDMFYDQPKTPPQMAGDSARWMKEQLREFALRYFMRVSSFRKPEPFVPEPRPEGDFLLRNLSWCTEPRTVREGFGFTQLFYKTVNNEIGKFEDPFAIVDMRDIGRRYEWIVLKVKIFDFSFKIRPFRDSESGLVFGLDEESYLVVNREFIVDQEKPRPGMLGRYAIGYGFIKSPNPGLLAYGPGEFDAAFEQIEFNVNEDGRVGVHMVFVVNRPARIANVSLNPLEWSLRLADLMTLGAASPVLDPLRAAINRVPFSLGSFDPVLTYISALNTITGGVAAENYCISKEQLDKTFLLQHFLQHYETAVGSLLTWRRVRDWLDEDSVPEWAKTGRSS